MTREEIRGLLLAPDEESLFGAASRLTHGIYGARVALRGLVEFSNVCAKNCLYCGIRRDNAGARRYRMTADEIVEAAGWAAEQGYGSVVLQSGEIRSEENTRFVEDVVARIHARHGDGFGITLSVGEQTEDVYRRWKDAGAHRYLLRIETSNPALYARLHPADHSWTARRDCLRALKRLGYVVGTGVMVGLPGQTADDLAADIEFFRDEDVDMIGMGPYIEDPGTPLWSGAPADGDARAEALRARFRLALRMIAAVRLCLKDVNIAAATALQAIDPEGREKGVRAGANVVMPNVTPVRYRADYRLYPNKPCVDEHSAACRACLARRLASVGAEIAWGERGDPLHYTKGGAS